MKNKKSLSKTNQNLKGNVMHYKRILIPLIIKKKWYQRQ